MIIGALTWTAVEAAPKAKFFGLVRWDPSMESAGTTGAWQRSDAGDLATRASVETSAADAKPALVPLREGFASAPAVHREATIQVPEPVGGEARGSASTNCDKFVDTKNVRRKTAPVIKKHTKASLEKARAALATVEATGRALAALDGDVYAKSSVGPRQSRWSMLGTLAEGAANPFQLLPLTRKKLRLLGAALKAGGYRSGAEYLKVAKAKHLQAGRTWDGILQATLADTTRSLARGLGAPERALEFDLEGLAAKGRTRAGKHSEGPCRPVAVGVCLALWMLRGLEGASLLGEQAAVSADRSWATLDLGPTKTDVKGKGCRRTLACACSSAEEHRRQPANLCPIAALEEVLRHRAEMGLGAKDPLFPRRGGRATTARGVCAELADITGTAVTEHSARRTGAKFYAARGVSEPHICYLGRWGSAVVRSYIEDAIGAQAVRAAQSATAGADWNPMAPATLSRKSVLKAEALLGTAEESRGKEDPALVVTAQAAAVRAANAAVDSALRDLYGRWAAAAEERIGGVRPAARGDQGETHEVLIGEGSLPTSVWVTTCGWRFGQTKHVRVPLAEVTCKTCKGRSGAS